LSIKALFVILEAMGKKIALVLGLGALVFAALFGFSRLKKGKAAIQINTIPTATVFIGGNQVGMTPYESDDIKPGEVDIKLVPEGGSANVWERRLTINPNTRLIIERQFSDNSEKEESKILYLEKMNDKNKAGLMLVSVPSGASVAVDGQMKGNASVQLDDVGAGDHKILVTHPGYETKEVLARTLAGYRLVIEVKLAKGETLAEQPEETNDSAKKEPSGPESPYILIEDTPTGWLRVRLEPSLSATEAAKVDPGQRFALLDEEEGWYKIEYKEGEEGWVSSRYAEKVTD